MKDRSPGIQRGRKARPVTIVALIVSGLVVIALATLLRTRASPVLRTTAVGRFPGGPIVLGPQGRLFVPNLTDLTVSVLDTHTGRLLRTIPIGSPSSQRITNAIGDSRSGRVFITTADNQLTVLDVRTGATVRTLSLLPCAGGQDIDERHARLFVADCLMGRVYMIDARSGRMVATTIVRGLPQEVAFDEYTGRVFVVGAGLEGKGVLSVLDAISGRVIHTFTFGAVLCLCITTPLPHNPMLVLDPPSGQVYALDAVSGRPLRVVTIGMDMYDRAVDPQTGRVFIVGAPLGVGISATPFAGPGRLVELDGRTGRVVRRLNLGAPPPALALDPQTRHLLLGYVGPTDKLGQPQGMGHVDVLDERSLQRLNSIPVGIVPEVIATDTSTRHAFVVNANIMMNGNINTYRATHVVLPEDAWHTLIRRAKNLLPWLPLRLPPQRIAPPNGSVTMLDLTQT